MRLGASILQCYRSYSENIMLCTSNKMYTGQGFFSLMQRYARAKKIGPACKFQSFLSPGPPNMQAQPDQFRPSPKNRKYDITRPCLGDCIIHFRQKHCVVLVKCSLPTVGKSLLSARNIVCSVLLVVHTVIKLYKLISCRNIFRKCGLPQAHASLHRAGLPTSARPDALRQVYLFNDYRLSTAMFSVNPEAVFCVCYL